MKTLHYSLICVLLLTCCTIYEKTIVKITPPPTKNIKVLPFVEILGETNAVIIWQVKNVENSFLEFKEEGEEIKIIPAVSSNELFRADVQKLEPNTIYYYRIAGTKSEFSKFKTLSKDKKKFSFAVLGDNRTNPKEFKSVADAVAQHNVDFIIHTGDMMTDGKWKYQWYKQWFTPGKAMFKNAPVLIAVGNHEYPWLEKSFWNYFYPDHSQFYNKGYYSYQNGNIFFIHLNPFQPFEPGSKQYLWLENTLKNCNLPFIVVALHLSAFTGAAHAKDEAVKSARQVLVPLFQKYNVNFVVSGHDHVYDRSEYDGTTYVIAGGAGAPLYNPRAYLNPFSVCAKQSLNFMICDADGEKIKVNVYDNKGNVLDTFSIPPRKIPKTFPAAYATFRPPWSNKVQSTDFDVYIRHFLSNELSGTVKTEISTDFEVLPTNCFNFVITTNDILKTLNFKLKLIDKKQSSYPVKVNVLLPGITNNMNFLLIY